MKGGGGARLILLHPSLHKASPATVTAALHHRLWIIISLSLFTLTLLLTFLHSAPHHPLSTTKPANTASSRLPPAVADALIHYAAATNATDRMSAAELASIATALRGRAPGNLLVFGLTAETLLWRALNHGGRTVFLDENEYLVAKFESSVPGFEGYDVHYTTRASEFREVISAAKSRRITDCRPVQNLLFSDCNLAINDLPNHLYSIDWDVIIVDGPSGYSPKSPGRTSAIFTAAVMARSSRGGAGGGKTDVFVHEFGRELERVSSEEFLCRENLVEVKGNLAHYALPEMDAGSFEFCTGGGADGGGKLKLNGSPSVALSSTELKLS